MPLLSDTIAAMRKSKMVYLLAAFIGLFLLATFLYWLPPIHERLAWRVDFALAYLDGVLDPVKGIPTPGTHKRLPPPQVITTNKLGTPTPMLAPSNTPEPEYTPTPTPSPTPIPGSISLPAPAWEKQDINNCGPATLTMYLRFYGWEGNQTNIMEVVKPAREDRNVNVEELAYFVRTHTGWLNIEYRVGGDLEMLKKLLAAGFPVMTEESFYFEEPFWPKDDLWAAHYQLLTGYDDATQTFTGQDSFYGADQKIAYADLDESWQKFNRVYIIIYPPAQEESIKMILGPHWDADYNRQHALEVSQSEAQEDPQNAFAWFNLGSNLTYFERYIEATEAYDKAREIGLPQRMLRYQFGPFIAYFHTGQMDDLLALTEYALRITKNSEEALLWRGWGLYRQGKTAEALEYFDQAQAANPTYQDAQYALDFVRANP